MFLSVENLTKIFEKNKKKFIALDEVSFSLNEGELVGLLGPNGSGKSTLINLLIGFYLPDKGDVKVYGESIYKNPKLVEKYIRIPFILEDPRFSVWEVLSLTAKFWGVKNWKEEVNYWLEFFELEKEKNTQIQKLSTGNYQKVRIIGALLSKPKLLLLDEITNGLDIIAANKLLDLLRKLNKEENISIIFASHIFSHVEKLCKRVLIIYKGKLLADDTIENLVRKAKLKEYLTIKTKEPLPNELVEKISKQFELVKVDEKTYKIVCEDASRELKRFAKFLAENPLMDQFIENIEIKEVTLEDVFAYFVSKA